MPSRTTVRESWVTALTVAVPSPTTLGDSAAGRRSFNSSTVGADCAVIEPVHPCERPERQRRLRGGTRWRERPPAAQAASGVAGERTAARSSLPVAVRRAGRGLDAELVDDRRHDLA